VLKIEMDIRIKNKILVIGFIVSLFIVYKFAVSNTIEVKKMVKNLNNEKLLLNNISDKILNLQVKEAQLDVILKKRNISINHSFQQTLLQNVNSLAEENSLQIIAFNEPHKYNSGITKLFTYSFEVKGDYISLLRMINHLESLQLGNLISVNFEKKKNFRSNIHYLTCKVLLQKVSS
jgi:hypothetical protein